MSAIDEQQFKEDFQRAFKYSRFEELKTFGDARLDAINAVCSLHGGSIHDHFERVNTALQEFCLNHKENWIDVRPEDHRWFQYFEKLIK